MGKEIGFIRRKQGGGSLGRGLLFPLGMIVLTALTLWILMRGVSLTDLTAAVSAAKLRWLAGGFTLMLVYVALEGLCIKITMETMGEKPSLCSCIRYAFVGFYFSGITPSASGGQPAQVYCMGKDRFSISKATLCLLLISSIYQLAMLFYGIGVYGVQHRFLSQAILPVKWLLLLGGGLNLILVAAILFMMFSRKWMERMIPAFGQLLRSIMCWGSKLASNKTRQRKNEGLGSQNESRSLERKLYHLTKEYAEGADYIKKNPGLVMTLFGITIARLTILYSMPYFVALAFGVAQHSAAQMVGLQAMLTLAVSSLPFPGSVGISEGTSLLLFGVMFSSGLLLPAMLLLRGISFYAVLAISGVVLVATSHRPSLGRSLPAEH